MKPHLYKIFLGVLIAIYLSSVVLSGIVSATPNKLQDRQSPPAKHEPKRGINPETGKLSFIGNGDPISVPGVSDAKGMSLPDRAQAIVNAYGKEFGLKNPSQELKLLKSQRDSNGKDVAHFQQTYKGIPVIAGEMIVNTNANGELLSISGEVSSDLIIDTKPVVKSQEASKTGLTEIAKLHNVDEKDLTVSNPDLWIFDESLLAASTRPAELVWLMDVTTKNATQPIREMVLVNSETGKVSWHINQVDTEELKRNTILLHLSKTDPIVSLADISQIQYADLVVDEARGVLYGADTAGNKIDVINMSDLSVTTSFILVSGALPTGIDLSPDGNELAIAQSGLSRVKFINLLDSTLSETPAALSGSNTKVTDVVYGRTGFLYALSSNGLHVINTTAFPHTEDSTQYIAGNSSAYSERFGAISSDKNTLFYITGTCCSGYNSLYKYNVSADLTKPVEVNHAYLYGSGSKTNLRLSLIDDNTLITSFGTIYNTSTFIPIAKNGQLSSSAIAIPGHNFYVTSYDNTSGLDSLYFFDPQSSYKISSLSTGVSGTPGALAVTNDGSTLFVSSTSGMTQYSIGSSAPGTPISLPQSTKQYRDFAFDMKRGVVYGTDASNRIDVIEQRSGNILNSYLLPNGANPTGIDLSPDGNELAVSLNGLEAILFLNPDTGAEITRVNPKINLSTYYTNRPFDVIYGRAGRLYSNGDDYIQVFDTTTHNWLARTSYYNTQDLALSTNNQYLYTNCSSICMLDAGIDSLPLVHTGGANYKFAVAPDGSRVFATGGQVWSGDLQEQLGTLEGGSGKLIKFIPGINVVALSASVTGGDVIRFLSPVNYRLLSTFGPINGSINEMESAPDGSRLFTNVNNTIQVLNLDPSLPMSLVIQSGLAQSVQVATDFQNPLKVKVSNVLGNPIANVLVTFQAPGSGASVTFADTQSNTTSVMTDANGIATSPLFSANSVAGTYSVQATVQNLNTSVGFQLTNLAAVNCTLASGSSSPTLFLPYKQYRCGKSAYGVATGDFNTDGRKDVALSTSDGTLLIYLQDASGNLPTQPRVYAGSGSSILAVGDLNHDGRDDIVVPGGNEIRVFLQKSDGTFPYPVIYQIGYAAGALAVGDVNHDGLQDIVFSFASNSIGVFTQKQDGTLNSIVTYPSLSSAEIAIGDVNGDGLNDVVSMSSQSSNQVQVFLQKNNSLNPYFSISLTSCSSSCSGGGIAIGDVTGDGRADIVMSYGGNRPYSYIAVFAQDANGNLLPPISYSSYDIPDPVEIADVNSDYLSDIIVLHSGWNSAGVYPQQTSDVPGAEALYTIPYKSWYYALDLNIADVNNDGLPDIVIADIGGLVVLYRNPVLPPTPSPIPTYTPSATPGPGPSRTPGPTSTAGPSPTPVPSSSTGNRRTYTASGGNTIPGAFLCDQNQSICTNGIDPDADQAHQYAADTFMFYNIHHHRNSFDDMGGTIISTVHYGIGYQNAFWDGSQMVYGDGMVADDVVGHEITHGVTQYTSNLIYAYQSGAINESFSDVWGEFIDQTNNSGTDSPSVRWLMGEDTPMGAIRSMSNPPTYGDPDKMSSPYYYNGYGDNGGVHINSGVNNKAAYLMVDGATFNGRTITGIGLNKTAAIYYEAQVNLLTAGANYNDLYYALNQACQNLIGGPDGITLGDCVQVQLATEAVEMIPAPLPVPTDISLSNNIVKENQQVGTLVGTLTTTDIDSKAFTYSLVVNGTACPAVTAPSNSAFKIGGVSSNELQTAVNLDYEAKNSYAICIRTNDGNSIFDKQFMITVMNVNEAPIITSNGGGATASVNVAENTLAVTTVVATDPDLPAQTLIDSISGGVDANLFNLNSSTGVLTFRSAPNFEAPTDNGANNVYNLTVQVSDGNGGTDTQDIVITVTNVNEAPTNLSLSNSNVNENQAVSTLIGTLSTTDTDSLAFTYSLVLNGTACPAATALNNSAFKIGGASSNELQTAISLDYESKSSYAICIRTNDGSATFDKQFTITVTHVNEVPVITSNGGGVTASINVAENNTAVTTVVATAVPAQTLTYSISGADAALFNVNSSTGVLTFLSAPNFEAPTDNDANNVYDVVAHVSDGNGGSDTQSIAVTVTNVNEAPTNLSLSNGTVNENVGVSTLVGTLSTTDVDSAAFTYSLVLNGTACPAATALNNSAFKIGGASSNELQTAIVLDFETQSWYTVCLRTNDGTSNFDKQFTISVNNVDENAPAVWSIVRADSNPTNAASMDFTVTFTEPVTGVDVSDFALNTVGIAGTSISGVNGSGAVYTVTVNAGQGTGFIRLDLVDDDGIQDLANNPLGGSGAGNGNYSSGEKYTKLNGGDTTGVFRPMNGLLYLKNKNETGFAELELNYGIPGDYPVVGDWDGNGTVTIGVYRQGKFYLRNSNSVGFADAVFAFGQVGDQPIAGDWNGDGIDTIGIYRPSTGQFLLRNSNDAGPADASFYLGNAGDVGIAGDWNGDGKDTVGVFRPSNGIIFLKNTNETGFAEIALNYGIPGDKPVTGDWNNDGIDTIGVYRNGQFMLRDSNTIGFADYVFGLGNPGDMPIAGNWDGLP